MLGFHGHRRELYTGNKESHATPLGRVGQLFQMDIHLQVHTGDKINNDHKQNVWMLCCSHRGLERGCVYTQPLPSPSPLSWALRHPKWWRANSHTHTHTQWVCEQQVLCGTSDLGREVNTDKTRGGGGKKQRNGVQHYTYSRPQNQQNSTGQWQELDRSIM